jgi:hypothetical protein
MQGTIRINNIAISALSHPERDQKKPRMGTAWPSGREAIVDKPLDKRVGVVFDE